MKTLTIYSSAGSLEIDPASGQVVSRQPDSPREELSEPYLSRFIRFDLDEWHKHYPDETCEGGDILDFGYWLDDGTYQEPEHEWREEVAVHVAEILAEEHDRVVASLGAGI